MATCIECNQEKPDSDFYVVKGKQLKHCKLCHRARMARTRNPDKQKAWASANREHLNGYMREYRKTHAFSAKGRVRQGMRDITPLWANTFFIKEAYKLARLRTDMTGIKWHVDHAIPINGGDVCGLHVETNLRVIPARLNQQKGNRHGNS